MNISDQLDWQIYFKKNDNGENADKSSAFFWTDSGDPLTFKSAYPTLKSILEISDNIEIKTKSEFKQGHRKKIFDQNQINEIKEMYFGGISKNKIAKHFGCSEKTIRNYLKCTD